MLKKKQAKKRIFTPRIALRVKHSDQGVLETNKNKFRFEPKQDLFRVCFGLFCETKKKNFGCFEPISKQPKQTDLFRNKPKRTDPKFSEKFPNILSFKLFGWVFCLFRFNGNSLFRHRRETTETNCFKTKKNEKKPENPKIFCKK